MNSKEKARSAGGAAKQATGCDTAGQQSHKQKYSTARQRKTSIYDLLPVGAENAVSRRQLSAITGIPDRQLRRRIAEDRKAGLLILSSTAEVGGGYFRPADTQELRPVGCNDDRAYQRDACGDPRRAGGISCGGGRGQ